MTLLLASCTTIACCSMQVRTRARSGLKAYAAALIATQELGFFTDIEQINRWAVPGLLCFGQVL